MNGRSKTDVAVTVVAFVAAGAAFFGAISLVAFFGVCGVGFFVQAGDRARRPKPSKFVLEALPDGLILGRDVSTGGPVVLTDQQLGAHTVLLGATGAGKTTTLLTILQDAIRRGLPVVAIDLKGSTEFGMQLQAAANAAGRPIHYWTLNGPGHWNPVQYGEPSSRTS